MEKDKLLDITHKTKVISHPCLCRWHGRQESVVRGQSTKCGIQRTKYEMEIKTRNLSILFLILFSVFCLLTSGCSMPRIIILDDVLSPEEYINLGVAYERQRKFDIAIDKFKKASKKLPIAYLYLGNVYMQKGDLDEAEKYYKKAIKEEPNLADAYNNLAWLYYTKKDNLQEAERLALKALELNPSNENYKNTLNKIRELKKH